MHDGWEYVAAAWGLSALVLGVWFWMILAKLRRVTPRATASAATGGDDD